MKVNTLEISKQTLKQIIKVCQEVRDNPHGRSGGALAVQVLALATAVMKENTNG